MSIRIETHIDHTSGSTRWVAKAMLDGRCICEVGEHGGPPDKSIDEIQARLCRKVADFVLTEWGEVVDQYWVERFQDGKQKWDQRTLLPGERPPRSDQ